VPPRVVLWENRCVLPRVDSLSCNKFGKLQNRFFSVWCLLTTFDHDDSRSDDLEGLGLNKLCALVTRDERAVSLDGTAAVAVDLEQAGNVELGLLHDLHLAHKHVLLKQKK
jgi:hypothetical protein